MADITEDKPVVVVGGGPAGLTAGYLLAKRGKPVIVGGHSTRRGVVIRRTVAPFITRRLPATPPSSSICA